jgi:hypothetical protein
MCVPVCLGRRQSVLIDRHRVQAQAGQAECAARRQITGVLHPRGVATVGEQPRTQVQPRLGTAGNDHLPGRDGKAAHGRELFGQRGPQDRLAAIWRMTQLARTRLAPRPVQAGPPAAKGEGTEIECTGREGQDVGVRPVLGLT